MINIYDKPTIEITIFNEKGIIGNHSTRWYFDKIMELGIAFDRVNDYSNDKDRTAADFEMNSEHLDITIYSGGYVLTTCFGDMYDVLKMIVFFDTLIPQDKEMFFSTYDGMFKDEKFKYKRGQSILEFANIIEKEYPGTYQLVLEEELKGKSRNRS